MNCTVGKLLDILETEWRGDYVKVVEVGVGNSSYRKVEIYKKDRMLCSFYQVRCGGNWFSADLHDIDINPSLRILINGRVLTTVGDIFEGYNMRSGRDVIDNIDISLFAHFDDSERVYSTVKSKLDKYYLYKVTEDKVFMVRKSDYKILVLHFGNTKYQILRGLDNLLSEGKYSLSDINDGFANIILGYLKRRGIVGDSILSLSDIGVSDILSLKSLVESIEED